MRIPHVLFFCSLLTMGLLMMGALHPFHVSIAQAEVAMNDDGSISLQIALRIDPDDLEQALERRTQTRVRLEKTKDVDLLIIDYLDEVFQVRHPALDKDSKPKPLEPCPLPSQSTTRPETKRSPPPTSQPDSKNKEPKCIIRWVGKEIEIQYAWLYFEICLPESGLEGLEFSNRIFFELDDAQTNTINFKDGDWTSSLRFDRNEAWKTLRKPAPPDPPATP